MRCVESHKVCTGYRNDDQFEFRYYMPPEQIPSQLSPPAMGERDIQPIRQHALKTFLDDYVVSPADTVLSRGFLDGLPALLAHVDASSDLAQATQLVANAGLGNRMNNPTSLEESRQQYGNLLRSFHRSLSHDIQALPIEALVTAVLLGLYEIISSNERDFGQHVAHVRGVGAILLEKTSPFDLSTSTNLFQLANPLIIKQPLQVCRQYGY